MEKEMKKRNIRKFNYKILLPPIISVMAAILIISAFTRQNDFSVVATVDGEPVTVRELKKVLLKKRADVYAYFADKYGAINGSEFWNRSFGGEIPVQKLITDAMDELISVKVQQLLAKENGIVQDITYKSFLNDLKRENANRKNALKSNQVIFGPYQYSEENYFDIRFSNMVADLKKKLLKEKSFDSSEIEQYYQENIYRFKEGDTVQIQKISVEYPDDEVKLKAEGFINDIKSRLDNGEDFKEVINSCNSDLALRIDIEDFIFEPQNSRADAMLYGDLYYTAAKLDEGQTSQLIIEKEEIYFIRCAERTEGKTVPIEEAEEFIQRELIEKEYEDMVKKRINDSGIVIDQKALERAVNNMLNKKGGV